MMTSEIALEIDAPADLSDIDEDAIPVLSEAVDLDDYLDMELGSNIDLAVDDLELLATAPNQSISEPAADAPVLPTLSESVSESRVEPATSLPPEVTAEDPDFVEIDTLSIVQATEAQPPKLMAAAHASVALLNNPVQPAATGVGFSADSSINAIALDPLQIQAKSVSIAASAAPAPKKENPFLPQHILDRLHGSSRNLVEEIAQSSAALEACTNLLRTRAVTDRLLSSATRLAAEDKSLVRKQKLVDELVDDYLPLIAAELRRRLHKMLEE